MSFTDFVHDERQLRLRIGDDLLADIGEEARRLGMRRVLVIGTPHMAPQVEAVSDALGELFAASIPEAVQHVPRESIVEAQKFVADSKADGCIAIGGGSTVGLAKALALESDADFPIIAMPTTYSGSEATKIWGISDDGRKTTGRDIRVAPKTILYVPSWTTSLPPGLSAASGVNAMAHCVEALYAVDRTPLTDLMSYEGIRALGAALPRILQEPGDLEARAEALWGAFLSGRALDAASLGLHHKLCHVLGGSFGMPHAQTHAVILPYATAYNAEAAPHAMAEIARALGADDGDAAAAIFALNREIGIPESLEAIGFPEDGIEQAADEVLQKEYPNPRPIERESVIELLRDAFAGNPPGTYGEAK